MGLEWSTVELYGGHSGKFPSPGHSLKLCASAFERLPCNNESYIVDERFLHAVEESLA